MKSIILLGAPGSGKGTQAQQLTQFGLTKISTGDLIRDEIARETSLGMEVKSLVSSGALVPDELIFRIFREALSSATTGFIADGFPRTLNQAKMFENLLTELHLPAPKVVFLDLNLDVLMKRILGRRTCSKCSKVYNIYFNPPVSENICDSDGATLMQREDDKESVIQNRFKLYQQEIEPVLGFYGNRVIKLDATEAPDKVFERISSDVR